MASNLTTTCASSPCEGDRQRLAQILDDYLIALERGEPITPADLQLRYPELANQLSEYLSGLRVFHNAVAIPAAEPVPIETVRGDQQLGDFRLEREIGRGGMGVVYEAVQVSLGRRVAIKVLPFTSAVDDKQIARFKNEAQAAAQVDHPNIVPVFAIGEEHGIYFFAMQLIGGQSLSQLLADLRTGVDDEMQSANESPGAVRMTDTLDRVLAVSEVGIQVAEALHAAHEIGVVHRDVKPSNLLLDGKGKVWVTDFGVARCKSGVRITETGDALGTVHYMSPEQAQAGLVDHRTDIYSLGVTLYELATLHHPFEDVPVAALVYGSGRYHVRRPCLWDRAIPVDFENIVLKAMAEGRDDRYATARDLADDLGRYLAGQPILARRPSLTSRLGKWARRHRRSVAAAVGVLILALAGSFASLVMIAAERAKRDQALRTAMANHERAEKNFRQAWQMLDHFGSRLPQRLANIPGMEEVRSELLFELLPYYHRFARESADQPVPTADLALTYGKIGYLSDQLFLQSDAEQAYKDAQRILEQLARSEPAQPQHLRNLALCCNNLGQLLHKRGAFDLARQQLERALTIQQPLVADSPRSIEYRTDLATTRSNLGLLFSQMGDGQLATDCFHAAIGIQESIRQSAPGDSTNLVNLAASYNNLSALFTAAQPDDARGWVEKAMALQLRLVQNHPRQRDYQSDLALSYNNLGTIHSRQTHWKDAEQCFLDAIDIQRRLVSVAPLVVAYSRDLAVSHNNLGMSYSRANAHFQAESSFQEALKIQRKLVDGHPQDINLLSALGGVYNNLGMIYQTKRDFAAASEAFQQAIAAQQRAFRRGPDVSNIRESLSKHYFNYAEVLRALNRPSDAADVVLARRKLWKSDPVRLLRVAEELAATCREMEHVEIRQRYLAEINATFLEAIEAGLEKTPDLSVPPFDVLSHDPKVVAALRNKSTAHAAVTGNEASVVQ